jgi:hypothetical protein
MEPGVPVRALSNFLDVSAGTVGKIDDCQPNHRGCLLTGGGSQSNGSLQIVLRGRAEECGVSG